MTSSGQVVKRTMRHDVELNAWQNVRRITPEAGSHLARQLRRVGVIRNQARRQSRVGAVRTKYHQRLRENRRKKEKGERTGDKRGEEFSGGGWTGGRKCLTIPRFNG